jgi:hypothetical protein
MKERWGITAAALMLAAAPAGAQVKLTPENADRIRQVGGEILFWNQEQRDKNFPAMETLFPGTVAKASPSTPPPSSPPITSPASSWYRTAASGWNATPAAIRARAATPASPSPSR